MMVRYITLGLVLPLVWITAELLVEFALAISGPFSVEWRYAGMISGGVCLCAMVLALLFARVLWGRMRSWSMTKCFVVACVVGVVLLVSVPLISSWFIFGTTDSDYQMISAFALNLSSSTELPPMAINVHALAMRGLSPFTFVAFGLPASEAGAYLDRVVVTNSLVLNGRIDKDLDVQPAELLRKWWWRPRGDRDWWYREDESEKLFIQFDDSRLTVYLMYVQK